MNLSRRTNEYFARFVGSWLKSDSIASHFVFELGGFEFLLDTIGKKDERAGTSETSPAHQVGKEGPRTGPSAQASSPAVDEPASSDIYDVLYGGAEEWEQEKTIAQPATGGEGAKSGSAS